MKRKDFSQLNIEAQKEKDFHFEHEDFVAGIPPFLRGIDSTMYVQKSWISNIKVDFPTSLATNIYLKEKISEGQTNFTIIFKNSSANIGIPISTEDDMLMLLNEIPLDTISILLQIPNDASLHIVSLFLETSTKLGFNNDALSFSITQIASDFSENSTKNRNDLILFCLENYQNFQSFSSPSILKNNEQPFETQLINFLNDADTLILDFFSKGISIDKIAPKLSFHWEIEESSLLEISKPRALRLLWAKFIYQFNPKNATSSALKIQANTTNLNTSFMAVFGGSQTITGTTEILDFIKLETSTTNTVDPWAGSQIIEEQTAFIASSVWVNFKKQLQ